ncbi:MAG: hypothetical protein AAB920_03295 [Patescibacteria group bacterium]
MKKVKQKLSKARSIPQVLVMLRATLPRSSERWKALQKLRVVVKEGLAKAKTEQRCMKILSSIPVCTVFEGEFRSIAVRNMLSMHTFSAAKCAHIISKSGSVLEKLALEEMFATAQTVEEYEITARLAPDSSQIKSVAKNKVLELRGEFHNLP